MVEQVAPPMVEPMADNFYSPLHRRNQKGFSLLEILIVLGILAIMAAISSRAIKGALQNKNKIDARLKTETVVFDALRFISTDIERAFHYQYALYEIDRQTILAQQQAALKPPQGGGSGGSGAPPVVPQQGGAAGDLQLPPPPQRLTQFIGKENQVHFTTTNHQRTVANVQESDQSEVGYYLADCKSNISGKTSRCLWRRSSTLIDNDVTRGGNAYALVENVSDFRLEYLSEDINDKEWKREWVSDNNGTANTQNMFPAQVKILLATNDPNNKNIGKFSQTIIATVRFPNNLDPAKRFAPNTNGAGTSPGAPVQPPPGGGGL